MLVVIGNYSLSQINFIAGTREIYILNWNDKLTYQNIISMSVNRGGSGNSSFILAEMGKWLCDIIQIDSTTYLIKYSHSFPVLDEYDGIQIIVDVNKPVDISITDQSSPAISIYALNILSNPILSSNTTIDSNLISLLSGHGCVVGNYLNFYGENRFNQSKVIGVTGNTIRLNAPMDVQFLTTDIIERGSNNMAVDGSIANKIFYAKPTTNTDWHICELVFYIDDNTAMDGNKFGGITALSKGVIIRKKNNDYDNLFEFSRNSDFDMSGDLKYDDRSSGSGVYSLLTKINLNDKGKYGVVIELLSSENDNIEIIIQDDLSELVNFHCHLHGHVVVN